MSDLAALRAAVRACHFEAEKPLLDRLVAASSIGPAERKAAAGDAAGLVRGMRSDSKPGLMEVFLAEYGLSTDEGIALMCLAEALLRVPDAETIDALIEDKIAPSSWGTHLGKSSSSLVNASTWALMLTGKVLKDGRALSDGRSVTTVLKGAVKRLGEPVIRVAVGRAMREMGHQFVLGETIGDAVRRGQAMQARGYTYSYDMLGEAALTQADADAFYKAYADSIAALAKHATADDIRDNPGISIKLSALHPRYEEGQKDRVMAELVPRTLSLAKAARAAGMGLNIDAEEADRLDLSLDVIEAVLSDPSLAGWDGFGVVVQAYGKRASAVLDWLHALAQGLDRRIMVRLVKGAYWDTEIKRAQVEGLPGFPVFTRKVSTDVAYACAAAKLLRMTDRIYPQFATHNAHTVAMVLELATDKRSFEFQRLHGMGESLHDMVLKREGTRCRIYAPVGAHRDLLAYLVRRLLENGANSSFVNQVLDENVPAERVAGDPFADLDVPENAAVQAPKDLYAPERANSRGWDLHNRDDLAEIEAARSAFGAHHWTARPRLAEGEGGDEPVEVRNPARPGDLVGTVHMATAQDVDQALGLATPWAASSAERAAVLTRASDLYEDNFGEIFALLTREAGKTPLDAIAEIREAVDFLRYYGARGQELQDPPRGVMACISPWNFPLAIFTGQIAAALAAGNAVVAKPAEATSLMADIAVRLMHEAGVPRSALQLLPGLGAVVGAALSSDPRVDGLVFTGSTATAQAINAAMADNLAPTAPLVAETGGLNAMIVDSTALPEQAIRDIVNSAFRSAGQRCSALRVLYVQKDVEKTILKMLKGAMDELRVGDPWDLATDIGPVIDQRAQAGIAAHIAQARAEGRILHELAAPKEGTFIAPTALRVDGIADLEQEIFGPVLHVATYRAEDIGKVVEAINATGYGLTFGMHSRIDDRIEFVTSRLNVGNIYVNRNQIGAIVGSQPFGGEGLSGTGPKAGGPAYVPRFTQPERVSLPGAPGKRLDLKAVQKHLSGLKRERHAPLSSVGLPGPTGESNRLAVFGRGVVLCLGPTLEAARAQAEVATGCGCQPVLLVPGAAAHEGLDGTLPLSALEFLDGFDAVALWAEEAPLRTARQALARRDGALLQLFAEQDLSQRLTHERHVCIDTTAAGGNASLLAQAS